MPRKPPHQFAGGWIDRNLPQRAVELIAEIAGRGDLVEKLRAITDPEKPEQKTIEQIEQIREAKTELCSLPLVEKIRHLIENYRVHKQVRDSRPSPGNIVDASEGVIKSIDTLLRQLDDLPVEAKAAATTATQTTCGPVEPFEFVETRAAQDLSLMKKGLVAVVGNTVKGEPGKRPRALEHYLLANTAALLKELPTVGKMEAAKLAAGVLKAAGVYGMPVDGKKAHAIVREVGKRSLETIPDGDDYRG